MATPTTPAGKKYFFGWTNIKWIIREFVAMYSSQPSYFSKKRFESSIAFLSAIGTMLFYVYAHWATITNGEIWADVALLFTIAGYAVNQIQKEKVVVHDTGGQVTSADQDTPQ